MTVYTLRRILKTLPQDAEVIPMMYNSEILSFDKKTSPDVILTFGEDNAMVDKIINLTNFSCKKENL